MQEVNNTPPAALLDLPNDKIERVLGDSVAGFWRAKAGATATLRPGDRGYTPPYVTREAYSWGGLARTSLGGGGALPSHRHRRAIRLDAAAAVRARQSGVLDGSLSNPADENETSSGRGLVRLFALGLTLLGVATAAELALGIVATQCFAAGQDPDCRNRLSFLSGLLDRPRMNGLLSPPPGRCSSSSSCGFSPRTASKYERAKAPQLFPDESETPDSVLGKKRFWARDQLVEGLGRVHVAAGMALVAFFLCLTVDAASSGTAGTMAQLVGAVSLALLAACCVSAVVAPTRDKPPATTSLLVMAVIVLGGAGISTWQLDLPDGSLPLPWTRWVPTVLVVALFVLLCTAFWLRAVSTPWMVALIGVVVLAAVVGPGLVGPGGGWRDLLLLAPPGVFILLWCRRISRRRAVAFSGGAPGVFLSIALYVALLESSLVLLGVGNWLNGSDNDAADLGGMPSETDLTVAVPYVLFGTASAFVSILFVLLLLAVAAWHLGVRPAGVAGREFP